MGNDTMDLTELAGYLRRDAREVSKLASRGHLPAHKVGGNWRFSRAEINQWLETQLPGYTEQQLTTVETSVGGEPDADVLLSALLPEECVAVPLRASTRVSVLRELVHVAGQSWQVYDPNAIFEAIRHREEMGSTALPLGVAIPHPRRALP